MSKQKRNKSDPKLVMTAAGKRSPRRSPLFFLATAIVVLVLLISSRLKSRSVASVNESNPVNPAAAVSNSEVQKLQGRWQRPDGGYIMSINSIAESGAIDAAYFNPYPIHVGNAVVSRDGNVTKVFVELRDVNYPGSSYTLTYEPSTDRLQGIYYQAVEQQRFQVVFERMK